MVRQVTPVAPEITGVPDPPAPANDPDGPEWIVWIRQGIAQRSVLVQPRDEWGNDGVAGTERITATLQRVRDGVISEAPGVVEVRAELGGPDSCYLGGRDTVDRVGRATMLPPLPPVLILRRSNPWVMELTQSPTASTRPESALGHRATGHAERALTGVGRCGDSSRFITAIDHGTGTSSPCRWMAPSCPAAPCPSPHACTRPSWRGAKTASARCVPPPPPRATATATRWLAVCDTASVCRCPTVLVPQEAEAKAAREETERLIMEESKRLDLEARTTAVSAQEAEALILQEEQKQRQQEAIRQKQEVRPGCRCHVPLRRDQPWAGAGRGSTGCSAAA